MNRARTVGVIAAALTACGSPSHLAPAAALTLTPDPTLTVSDTATLTASDASVHLTATLTCQAGHTAFGSAAVTDNANAGDLTQPQGYTGLLRIACTGQPQELHLTLTSGRTRFRAGPALARAAFTLNLCDPGCRSVSVTKTITNTRPPTTTQEGRRP